MGGARRGRGPLVLGADAPRAAPPPGSVHAPHRGLGAARRHGRGGRVRHRLAHDPPRRGGRPRPRRGRLLARAGGPGPPGGGCRGGRRHVRGRWHRGSRRARPTRRRGGAARLPPPPRRRRDRRRVHQGRCGAGPGRPPRRARADLVRGRAGGPRPRRPGAAPRRAPADGPGPAPPPPGGRRGARHPRRDRPARCGRVAVRAVTQGAAVRPRRAGRAPRAGRVRRAGAVARAVARPAGRPGAAAGRAVAAPPVARRARPAAPPCGRLRPARRAAARPPGDSWVFELYLCGRAAAPA